MAYNKTSNPLDPTGRAILVQVALKGAVEAATASGSYDEDVFNNTFPVFVETLTGTVQVQKDEFFDNLPKKAATADEPTQQYDAEAGLADELGATSVDTDVRILNKEGPAGPIPSWAVAQFKAAGVTKVFDNRATKTGNQPWFKTPKDAEKYGEPSDKAFWPPRD